MFRYLLVSLSLILCVFAMTFVACTAFGSREKSAALLTQDVGCALANIFLPNEKLQEVCQIADKSMPAILNLVSAQRVAMKREHEVGVSEGVSKAGCSTSVLKDAGTRD